MVPGCAGYEEKVDQPGGFVLPHPPRDTRTFATDQRQRAIFTVSPIEVLHVPEGRLLLQTMRSHDQFNTTIYGLDDRYRGIKDGRRVVFVNPDDIESLGLRDGQHVDIVSEWDGRLDAHAPIGSASSPTTRPGGALRPTTPRPTRWSRWTPRPNGSNQPAYKSIVVRLVPSVPDAPAQGRPEGTCTDPSPDPGHDPQRYVEPSQLS